MTVAFERTRAVNNARYFLQQLMDSRATPRVPLEIRRQARSLLKHYPTDWDMEQIAEIPNPIFSHLADWNQNE